ncbi:MAG: hypothetical protein IT261_00210 [Saprospiraceae bacterium]|nr:hypothetical protein [Saprospiraceae bacterium]
MNTACRTLLLLLFCPVLLVAGTPPSSNPFSDQPACWDQEFQALSELEQLVETSGLSLSQLKSEDHPLADAVMPDTDISATLMGGPNGEGERLLEIPGFFWGFCCSIFGAILVYLAIDDPVAKKREGRQAILGCAVGTLLWVGLYVWLIVSLNYY